MNTITLPATCDRAAAKAIHPELCDALGPAPLRVDASNVARIGQAMFQLLIAAGREGGGIEVHTPSQPYRDAAALAGLSELTSGEEPA
ncbi:MAG: STAS domain-containing protein [Pseudomonadota bacterium]